MAEYTGRKVGFGLGIESVRGTAVTAPDYWLNHMSVGFYERAEKVNNESALGNLVTANDSATMHQWAEGDFELKVGSESVGTLLYAGMGGYSTVNDGTNAEHSFSLSELNTPASFTMFRYDPNEGTKAFPLGMLSSLEFSAELGGWLMASGTAIAKKGATVAATPARIAEREFKPKHLSVKLASSLAGLDAATAQATLQSFRLTIDRSVERDHQLGQEDPYDLSVRQIEVTGEFVLRHTSATFRDYFLNDTQRALRISAVNDDAAPAHELIFNLPKVTFSDWSIDQGLGDMVNQTVGFTGLFDVTAGTALDAVLRNAVLDYNNVS